LFRFICVSGFSIYVSFFSSAQDSFARFHFYVSSFGFPIFLFFWFYSTVCISVFLLFSVSLGFLWVFRFSAQIEFPNLFLFGSIFYFYFLFHSVYGSFLFTRSFALIVFLS
jgi:hypothetical protein